MMTTTSQQALLLFTIHENRYAFRIEDVLEVAPLVAQVALQGAPPALIGMINRHGESLPLWDLRVLFGQSPSVLSLSTLFVVLELAERGRMGAVVDSVEQVIYVPLEALTPNHNSPYVPFLTTYADFLIQLIDPFALFPLGSAT